ncbi:beta-1,3-glucosyltransferase-like isoform X2 [Uranotaenia lowii]|uniref:beta-1,3-glucosyltransferase-like isoform X2 n=1 Tax=Uranotaenia lowii TaxID=190385 RepID=UPI00247A8469|nr:beta-1,3-glucosyltransferase-like isoform X2 [Uranotaenia lowii]
MHSSPVVIFSDMLPGAVVWLLLLLLTALSADAEGALPKTALDPLEISYLVLSQPTLYHSQRANKLRSSILKQQSDIAKVNQSAITTGSQPPNVHLSHELFEDHEGSWAITPILRRLRANILRTTSVQTRWLIICEENSHVNVSLLVHHLAKEDYRQDLFLGYPLYDREATIIHHFAFFKNPSSFLYPYLRAGIALSIPLVDHLCRLLSAAGTKLTEFFIDAGHEFALLVWNGGTGQPLSSRSYFCAHRRPSQGCAIMVGAALMEPGRPTKEEFETASSCSIGPRTKSKSNRSIRPFGQDNIIFAVKTCEKFHEDRVLVLLNTWAKYVQHLRLYSDISDVSIPTVGIPIPNTSAGHCAKTLEILRLIGEEISQNASLSDVKWIMLVDDDTILSPSALLRYLGNFNPNQDLYIGERYGYHLVSREDYLDPDYESGRHQHHHHHQGYNYITGGGGIIISVKILDALLRWCECPSASSPDDMILAACLFQLGVRPIHSPLFHQARPSDYAPEVLAADRPAIVSFHKHWQIDPYQVYNRWFRANDEQWWNRQQTGCHFSPSLGPNGGGHDDPSNEPNPPKRTDERDEATKGQTEVNLVGKPLLQQPKHISCNDNDSTGEQNNHVLLPKDVSRTTQQRDAPMPIRPIPTNTDEQTGPGLTSSSAAKRQTDESEATEDYDDSNGLALALETEPTDDTTTTTDDDTTTVSATRSVMANDCHRYQQQRCRRIDHGDHRTEQQKSEHISKHYFCENNELQSNNNLLPMLMLTQPQHHHPRQNPPNQLHPHQQEPNIIKPAAEL